MTPTPFRAERAHLLLFALMTSRWVVYGFSEVALTVILRDAGASLFQISLMLGAGVLFMFKFLWAPLVDRRSKQGRTRYVRWFVFAQITLAAALMLLWPLSPTGDFYLIFGVMVAASLVASFRDIAMDGLAIELVDDAQRARANGWLSAGFMLGMLLGGGALLMVYAQLQWAGAIAVLVGATLAPLPLVLWMARRAAPAPASVAERRPWLQMFKAYFAEPGNGRWSLFLVCHAISAVAGSSLIGVILVDIQWPLTRIGLVMNILGPAAAALVSLLAGWVFSRHARRSCLLVTMLLQALLNLALLPLIANQYAVPVAGFVVVTLVVATAVANLIIKTVAMDRSAASDDKATHFTLQGSMSQAGGLVALVAAPAAAQVLGYQTVVLFGLVAGVASLALLTGPGLTRAVKAA
jgi:PAT family beta-lactamase induction signal transducer AmpG